MERQAGGRLKDQFLREGFRQFRKSEALLHPLKYLFWECTLRCNLTCLHCGSDCHVDSKIVDMPAEVFLQEMEHLSKRYPAKDVMVVVTGGEPLLRKDLPEIGLALRNLGFRWGMVTNGYQLNKDLLNNLVSCGLGAITLSLDGLADTHNWLRNRPDAFDRSIQALRQILSYPRLQADVVTCVNQRNLKELPELYLLLANLGLKNWRLFTITPIGRARDYPELELAPSEFKRLLEFIEDKRSGSGTLQTQFSCESYLGKTDTRVRDSYFFCRAGIHIASILADGSVSACPNIDRDLIQGSIYQNHFTSIWESGFKDFRNRDWNKVEACEHCKEYKHCGGSGLHWWEFKTKKLLKCHYHETKA